MKPSRFFGPLEVPTPILKQAPTTMLFVAALVFCAFFPSQFVSHVVVVLIGATLVVIATLLAIFLTPNPANWHLAIIVPAIDFFAIGALRFGTGGDRSAFVALVVLPVVWVAAEAGRRFIAFASAGTMIALVTPLALVLGQTLFTQAPLLLRTVFTTFAFTIVAAIVNELARHARLRLHSAQQLATRREGLLRESRVHAEQLAQSARRLGDLERMYRGLWDAITEQSVIGTDKTGLIDAWNRGATKLIGLTDKQTENSRHILDFHLKEELDARSRELNFPAGETVLNPGFSALVERSRLGEADVREWTYVRADGTRFPVELSVTPRLDEDGNTVGYLFVASDLTRAKEVSRLKDEFIGLISHELRTPLSSILGYLELLRDDEEDALSDSQLHYLSVAERNAHRLLRLVGDLLFTAQVDSGTFRIDRQVLELESIVTVSVENARPAATSAGVTLLARIDSPASVNGDAVRLGQACDNLISNAIKFTPNGGKVTVTLRVDGADAVIDITDTGLGIAEAELDQLFARFFRATTATKNAVPGVGLGLVITKAIVTAHGGSLDVTSEEGFGTTFELRVPLA